MELLDFAWFSQLELSIEILSKMAMPENWQYRHQPDPLHHHPILFNYLKATFSKLYNDNLIAYSEDKACFNTGLLTSNQEEIYALFGKNTKTDMQPYFFYKFHSESDRELKLFQPLPPMATYYSEPSELIFDTRLEIRPDFEHIIEENLSRFSPPYNDPKNKYMLNLAIRGAIEIAVKRVKRNYRIAVPQYYQSTIQLLLPLCLSDPEKADLALVVEKDPEGFYRASTCLTLDMAYSNARVLAKQDPDWLI